MGISGVRGLVHKTIDAETVFRFGYAYGSLFPGTKVVIGRDGRGSGDEFLQALLAGLHIHRVVTRDIGIAPTPTVIHSVRTTQANGGIIITASHNPIEWNGLKFINAKGEFIDPSTIERLFHEFAACSEAYNVTPVLSLHEQDPDACKNHVNAILKQVDLPSIQARHFSVAVDTCHGAGAVIDPYLFEQIRASVFSVGYIPNGAFEHMPEPLPENMVDLANAVKKSNAHVGFYQDPDADRISVVDETGTIIGEEYALVLCAESILSHPNAPDGPIVVNLSTSRMIEDVAKKYGRTVLRSAVGEMNVINMMKKHSAVFGGEGSGGIIWPQATYCRDSIAGIALVLDLMARSGKNISELVAQIPRYEIVKAKKELTDMGEVAALYAKAKSRFMDILPDTTDGMRFAFIDSWLHIRPSNTEPIVRIFAEAPTKEAAQALVDIVIK